MGSLQIKIEPCDVFRFRYKSECKDSHGRLKGSLPDTPENKESNFPTVKLHNWDNSQDNIVIKASLYTAEQEHRPHILSLFGKNCEHGECCETISEDGTAVFRYLGIESKRKNEAIDLLKEKIKLDGKRYNEEQILKKAEAEFELLNMNCAVLCFEAFWNGSSISPKVFSTPITNSKAAPLDLKITRISRCTGSSEGGDDVILLCEKFKKADKIEIHFFEKGGNNVEPWEAKGIFNQSDIHHQVAIYFKTPKYHDPYGGAVFIKLYRPTDEQCSEPIPFEYTIDSLRYSKKRKRDSYGSLDSSNSQASTSSCYRSLSHVSPMEEVSNQRETPQLNLSANISTLSGYGFPVDNEAVASTSSKIGSTQLHLSENDLILSDNDSPNDSEVEDFLNQNYGGWVSKLQWPIPQKDLDNNLPKEQSSEVKPDAAEPNELYSELEGEIIENMEQNALHHPILSQSSTPICGATLTSGTDETIFGMISSGIRYLGNFMPSLEEPIDEPHSSSMIPSIRDLKNMALYGLGSGIEKVASYIKPSHDSETNKAISKYELINAAAKDSYKTSNKVYGESGLCLNMQHLSIENKTEHTKAAEDNISMELPITSNAQSQTNENSEENKDSKNEVVINRDFEHFIEGINCIMKNREKDVYLQYISKLMPVADADGNTFLHLAVKEQNKNVNLIAKILKICPDFVNKQNNFKETPLHLATKINAYKVVLLLLSEGGNSSIVDANGNNCFHITSKFNLTNSMKILLLPCIKYSKHMPSINEINYEGLAPMHLAVLNNSKECLKLLVQAGADVNIKDRKSGSSPLHFAMKNQPSLVHDLLLHSHVNLLNKDFCGDTFVHILCNMKGVPFPSINQSRDLLNWAHQTLALPSIDTCEDSSASSDTDSSDEENDYEEGTTATTNGEDSALAQSSITNNVDRNSFNEDCEERLMGYLDDGYHWRKLGLSIGFDEKTLNGLETLSKNSSPSKIILKKMKNLYKNCDKQTLINILTEADLKEAVKILN